LQSNAFNYKQKSLNKFLLLQKNNILTAKNINKMIDDHVMLISPFIEQNKKNGLLTIFIILKVVVFTMKSL